MLVDPTNLDPRDVYRLMITVVVPRPIAWVSTRSAGGVLNAAPFSYFQALGSKPPTVMIAVGNRRAGEPKDTRRNIEETGEFVVNLVGEEHGAAMVRTSVDHPYGVSEFDEAGLTAVPSEVVAPPRIGGCGVALECRLEQSLEIAGSGVLVGRVVMFHLDDRLVDEDGRVDPLRLRPLGRLGGKCYSTIGELREIDADGATRTVWSAKLDLWRELRARTVALARSLDGDQLARSANGRTVGAMLGELADGFESSWTGGRLAESLQSEQAAYLEESAHAHPEEIDERIRREARIQGQVELLVPESASEY